jgi:hypothetical protein
MQANGGRIGRYASGGLTKMAESLKPAIKHASGGRADKILTTVPVDTFIIPADVVAAIGDGNTDAGFSELTKAFPAPKKTNPKNQGKVKVRLSGGEFKIHPEHVRAIGKGDPDAGAQALSEMVMKIRNQHVEKLKTLEPPSV